MGLGRPPKFKGAVANGATKYIGLPVRDGAVGAGIGWDATASGTFTLELTSQPATDAPVETAGTADQWKDSGLVIASPTGAGVGGTTVHADNVRARRARLKYVAAANSALTVHDGTDV